MQAFDFVDHLTEKQFVELLARHERRVRGFVASLLRYRDDVDEIVQQTFLTGWEKMGDFSVVKETLDRDFLRWICTIAKFCTLAYRRKRDNSRLIFSSDLVMELADLQLSNTTLMEGRLEALSGCIEKLDAKQKALVRRHYTASESAESVASIAEQSGVSRQAIFKRLRHIRAALADCVDKSLGLQRA